MAYHDIVKYVAMLSNAGITSSFMGIQDKHPYVGGLVAFLAAHLWLPLHVLLRTIPSSDGPAREMMVLD
jgi:hypothetical protein